MKEMSDSDIRFAKIIYGVLLLGIAILSYLAGEVNKGTLVFFTWATMYFLYMNLPRIVNNETNTTVTILLLMFVVFIFSSLYLNL